MSTKQFYDHVEELLEERGWSRNKLAEEAGIPKSTLYNMMSNRSEPKLETMESIINGFHLSEADFWIHSENSKELSKSQVELIKITEKLTNTQIERVKAYALGICGEND